MSKNEGVSSEIILSRIHYINAIKSIIPGDDSEAIDIQDTLTWLRSTLQIHKPYNMERHLGVLFLVLSPNRRYTYMLNHKKAQTWLPPGGHVDLGLTFQDAVRLEMREELYKNAVFIYNHPFFLTNTLTRGKNAGHIDTTAWFLVEGNPNEQYDFKEKEASEAKWMNIEALRYMPDSTHLPRAAVKLPQYIDK